MHVVKTRMLAMVAILLLVGSSAGSEYNLTMPEEPLESSITAEDDSEQELSSQLQEVDSRSGGWSSWSEWSACSRSCDGGVAHQLRNCNSGTCRGDHVRYKICNMQVYVLFAVLAVANAGVLVAPSAGVIQGPSTRTTVAGPDGSVINAVAPGGRIVTDQSHGVVAHTAPVVAHAAYAHTPYVAHTAYAHAPVVAHTAYAAPWAHGVVAHHGLYY